MPVAAKATPWMPPEWAPHDATWLAFPHNVADWPGKFGAIPWAYAELVKKASVGETVHLLVRDRAHLRRTRSILERSGIDLGRIHFHDFRTNRGWMRDTGPIFTVVAYKQPRVQVAEFGFNGWAKYPDWKLDDRVAERAAAVLGVRAVAVRHRGRKVVLEGGAIDVDGAGTLLTTEECLLDPEVQVRNPGFSRQDYEAVFAAVLGVRHTIWLGRGIAGDDTHGHVDDLARFVGPRTIVLCEEKRGQDPNHAVLEENRERLAGARLADGSKPEVVALPMPDPVIFAGQRLPASYANFYFTNAALLVPTFNDPQDRMALGILAELVRDRPVVGIHALDLVWGLGTLHCLSQQQPAPSAAPRGDS